MPDVVNAHNVTLSTSKKFPSKVITLEFAYNLAPLIYKCFIIAKELSHMRENICCLGWNMAKLLHYKRV